METSLQTSSTFTEYALLSGLGIALATMGTGLAGQALVPTEHRWTVGTHAFAVVEAAIDPATVLAALGGLHDRLLNQTTELDSEARDVLYKNLWDLYQA